jgi:hypothetical protein
MRAGLGLDEKLIRDLGNRACERQRADKIVCITTVLLPELRVKVRALPPFAPF